MGLGAWPPPLFLVYLQHARARAAAAEQSTVRQDMRDLRRNRPWMVLFFLALIIMVTITLRMPARPTTSSTSWAGPSCWPRSSAYLLAPATARR